MLRFEEMRLYRGVLGYRAAIWGKFAVFQVEQSVDFPLDGSR